MLLTWGCRSCLRGEGGKETLAYFDRAFYERLVWTYVIHPEFKIH